MAVGIQVVQRDVLYCGIIDIQYLHRAVFAFHLYRWNTNQAEKHD